MINRRLLDGSHAQRQRGTSSVELLLFGISPHLTRAKGDFWSNRCHAAEGEFALFPGKL